MRAARRSRTAASDPLNERRFRFAAFEFAGPLGPAPGRYVVRRYVGAEAGQVVVVQGAAAPARRGWTARRARLRGVTPEPPPAIVDLSRVTIVDAEPLEDLTAARAWLADGAAVVAMATGALGLLNRVIAAHRLGAADPYVRERAAADALVQRAGYGPGEAVAEGRWEAAVELPPPALPRSKALLSPQERVAALLGSRDAALACEELALRARLDADQGRPREAALQLRAALDAALAELAAFMAVPGVASRYGPLRDRHAPAAAAAAQAALRGALEPADERAVADALAALEAILRARLAGQA